MSHWQLWFAQHALDYSGGERYKCHATTLIDHMCTSVYNSHDYKLYISTLRNTYNYNYNKVIVTSSSRHPPGGAHRTLLHSLTRDLPFLAASL